MKTLLLIMLVTSMGAFVLIGLTMWILHKKGLIFNADIKEEKSTEIKEKVKE